MCVREAVWKCVGVARRLAAALLLPWITSTVDAAFTEARSDELPATSSVGDSGREVKGCCLTVNALNRNYI